MRRRELTELTEEYRVTRRRATQQQLAELEEEIAEWRPVSAGALTYKWMVELLGGKLTQYDVRSREEINACGIAAKPIWERMEHGMAPGTAVRIVRDAKRKAGKHNLAGLVREVQEQLRLHDRLPPSTKAEVAVSAPSAETLAEASRGAASDPRKFWTSIRQLVIAFAEEQLSDLGPSERERLLSNLDSDLKGVLDHNAHAWSIARRSAKTGRKITRSSMRDACNVLKIDPPKRGQVVDMHAARRAQRDLARLYHPDRNQNLDTEQEVRMRKQYEGVNIAYATLERWSQENPRPDSSGSDDDTEPRKPEPRVVRGGG